MEKRGKGETDEVYFVLFLRLGIDVPRRTQLHCNASIPRGQGLHLAGGVFYHGGCVLHLLWALLWLFLKPD